MKRYLSFFLVMTMLLSLTACGGEKGGAAEDQADTAQGKTVTYEVQTETYTDSCTYEDGTVIAFCSFDMPRLHAFLSDGTEVSEDLAASQPSEVVSKALSVVTAFNAEMDGQLGSKRAFVQEMYDWAKEDYAGALKGERPWYEQYVEEQTFTVYQTETLVSICMQFYDYLGGAHPNNGYNTYNFDLSTGEMVTYVDLVDDEEEFRRTVSDEILYQIQTEDLAEELYEDYEVYVRELLHADECFNESGVYFIFEEYTMGPHAAGSPNFVIPYSMIANLLNARGERLLCLKAEDYALADFYEAQELWRYFDMTTMPLDCEDRIEVGEYTYYRVNYRDLNTMDDLRALLLTRFDTAIVDELLAPFESGVAHYRDIDGVLYGIGCERGSDISRGDATYAVEINADGSGKVIATVEDYDENGPILNEQTGEYEWDISGYSTIEFPFVLTENGAQFTHFESIW